MSYDFPGVFVEEPTTLSLSVMEGATAVPVIAYKTDTSIQCDYIDAGTKKVTNAVTYADIFKNKAADAFACDGWMDFMAAVNSDLFQEIKANPKETDTVKISTAKTTENERVAKLAALLISPLFAGMQAYFSNGGGRCYLSPLDEVSKTALQNDDVTLIVAGGEELKPYLEAECPENIFVIQDLTTLDSQGNPDLSKITPYPRSAVYYPSLVSSLNAKAEIPASFAVAGAYCRVDRERGVWKAPANVSLVGVVPKVNVSDTMQAKYTVGTPHALNMIRTFRDGNTLIWGARTMQNDNTLWNYVPVRRLFNAAEKDIRAAMQPAVFEPNTAATWEIVRSAIDSYLHSIWMRGGLAGASPKEAYFVQVGLKVTMSQDEIDQGIMRVRVGMAAVRPAEFIILEFQQYTAAAA